MTGRFFPSVRRRRNFGKSLRRRRTSTVDEIKGVIGLPLDGCMRGLGVADEGDVTELCATYRRIFPDVAMSQIELFPEVKDTLIEPHKQGKRLAIATSRNKVSLERGVRGLVHDTILPGGSSTCPLTLVNGLGHFRR